MQRCIVCRCCAQRVVSYFAVEPFIAISLSARPDATYVTYLPMKSLCGRDNNHELLQQACHCRGQTWVQFPRNFHTKVRMEISAATEDISLSSQMDLAFQYHSRYIYICMWKESLLLFKLWLKFGFYFLVCFPAELILELAFRRFWFFCCSYNVNTCQISFCKIENK